MNIEILTSLNKEEKSQIVVLLVDAFDGKADAEFFASFLDNVPYKKYIVVKDQGKCIGILILLDRCLYVNGVSIDVTGLSYMAVDRNYKSFKVTNLLKKDLFNYLKNNTVLSMGVARKALDGYWSPYGYVGVTNFAELWLESSTIEEPIIDYEVVDWERSNQLKIADLYTTTYSGLSGGIARDQDVWRYCLTRVEKENITLKCVMCNSTIIAYFIYQDARILEVAGLPDVMRELPKVIHQYLLSLDSKIDKVIYEIGLAHPMVAWLRKYNHQINQRFAWNGGHIIRIESVIEFLKQLRPELEKKLSRLNVNDFELDVAGIKFHYTTGNLEFSENNECSEKLSSREWVQLLFGVVAVEQIESINIESRELLTAMFGNLNFQVPLLDQM